MYRRQQSGFDRVPLVQSCEVEHDGARHRALICNLSILGAYVHSPSPPPRDSRVTLTFGLPDDGPEVRAGGSVTWVHEAPEESPTSLPRGFGLRFLTAAPDDLRRIATLVAGFLAAAESQYQVGVGLPPSGQARIPFVSDCVWTGEGGERPGCVCNLSTLGAFVALDSLPAPGERGRLRFSVPGIAGDFQVDATVVWVNSDNPRRMRALPVGCGFRFEGMSFLDEAILTTIVESYRGANAVERGVAVDAAG